MKTPAPDSHRIAANHPNGSTIRFTVAGLVILCVSLVAVTAFLTRSLVPHDSPVAVAPSGAVAAAIVPPAQPATEPGPWGDMVTLDIEIEQPEEYVSFEATHDRVTTWTFPSTTLGEVRTLMTNSGLTAAQADAAMADDRTESTAEATIVKPPDAVILAIEPGVRAKFYEVLARWPENKYMRQPYHLPKGDFAALFVKSEVEPEALETLKKLMYRRGGNWYFSDPELLLRRIGSEDGRMHLLKALTYQTAALVNLRLHPDSDIDKILGYWDTAPWVRTKDLRPLLESVKNTPDGGVVSLLYFLPPFARERLYTFPQPERPGDPKMDCHWTALNFFNDQPDDRLQDPEYASAHIRDSFYQIGKPSMCGDLVFLLDSGGGVIHSAVYLADDIVFTKNGVNFGQPWILMRMKNLLDVYNQGTAPAVMYYRRREI